MVTIPLPGWFDWESRLEAIVPAVHDRPARPHAEGQQSKELLAIKTGYPLAGNVLRHPWGLLRNQWCDGSLACVERLQPSCYGSPDFRDIIRGKWLCPTKSQPFLFPPSTETQKHRNTDYVFSYN